MEVHLLVKLVPFSLMFRKVSFEEHHQEDNFRSCSGLNKGCVHF